MRSSLKSWLHIVGNILAVAGIGFVGGKLWSYADQIDFTRLTPALWTSIAGLIIFYGSANFLLAIAWKKLLAQVGHEEGARWCIRTYGISQIAKYVPGNIFQFAGRQAMGMSHGIDGWVLARSTFLELTLLCLGGAIFGVLVAPVFIASIPERILLLLFLFLATLSVLLIKYVVGRFAAQALLMYLIFLTISGAVFATLINLINIDGVAIFSGPFLAGAFVVAWLIGLVTPGAPAGVGVREAVIAIALGGVLPMQDLLLAVVLGRLITVSGDVLFCVVSSRISAH